MRLPVLHKLPALEPERLSDVAERAVEEMLREGESKNTLASYRSALRYWAAWFGLRYGVRISLPVPVAAIQQFVVDHAQRTTDAGMKYELPPAIDQALVAQGFKAKAGPLALNTIVHRVAVLSKAHQLHESKNPCQDPKVKELLSKTRRAYAKRGELPQKKDALTRDPFNVLLESCDASLRGKRDRALLLFAWATGGRRRSEVASADLKFLKTDSSGEFTYLLAHSKTNQAGVQRPEDFKPIVGTAADALAEWLRVSGIKDGAIFRRIRRGDHVGEPLSAAAVRDIVIRRCELAGLQGAYSAHSLRSGFVTEAGVLGLSLADTMALTGHRSVQTVMGYSRAQPTVRAAAARLLRD
jgi:integrase